IGARSRQPSRSESVRTVLVRAGMSSLLFRRFRKGRILTPSGYESISLVVSPVPAWLHGYVTKRLGLGAAAAFLVSGGLLAQPQAVKPASNTEKAEKPAEKAAGPHVPFIEGRPFAEILRKAKAEKKPVMIDVYAVWCGPCKIMDRTTFMD